MTQSNDKSTFVVLKSRETANNDHQYQMSANLTNMRLAEDVYTSAGNYEEDEYGDDR